MALSNKERKKMQDAMLVAGTLRAGWEVASMTGKAYKSIKKSAKKRKDKRTYKNNKYQEGK